MRHDHPGLRQRHARTNRCSASPRCQLRLSLAITLDAGMDVTCGHPPCAQYVSKRVSGGHVSAGQARTQQRTPEPLLLPGRLGPPAPRRRRSHRPSRKLWEPSSDAGSGPAGVRAGQHRRGSAGAAGTRDERAPGTHSLVRLAVEQDFVYWVHAAGSSAVGIGACGPAGRRRWHLLVWESATRRTACGGRGCPGCKRPAGGRCLRWPSPGRAACARWSYPRPASRCRGGCAAAAGRAARRAPAVTARGGAAG